MIESRFPLSKSATYRNEVADFFVYLRQKTGLKRPFYGSASPLPLHKTPHWKRVFSPVSNDAK